jgi:hypothetical protein
MEDLQLTPEQEAEAQRITSLVLGAMEKDVIQMARLMASKQNKDLLGQTEFEIRDISHQMGAKVVETALEGRKKGGTKVRA